jgi:response regulator RpfG family c-di-GMP phosphodiesterase
MADTIYRTIADARTAFEEAESAIAEAKAQGFLMGPVEEELLKAKTSLIELRAQQHTVLLPSVDEKATEVKEISAEVTQQARDALAQGVVRRREMALAIVGIAITIGLLALMKRELDRGWKESQESVQ